MSIRSSSDSAGGGDYVEMQGTRILANTWKDIPLTKGEDRHEGNINRVVLIWDAVAQQKKQGEYSILMYPRIRVAIHPEGPLLLHYTTDGCHVDVGRPWTKAAKMIAMEQGPHKSALTRDAIMMMYFEVQKKVQDCFAEVCYLDEIEDLLRTAKREHLKISPLAMVSHISCKLRVVLDILFSLKLFGMTIPSVNEYTNFTAHQESMRELGLVLLRGWPYFCKKVSGS